MSIKDVESLKVRQIDSLKRQQAREIARLQEGHDLHKADMKKENAMEIVDLQNEHVHHVDGEAQKKEKVLTQMKDHLEQTRQFTARQIKELKEQTSKVKQQEHAKLSAERDRVKSEHDLYLEDQHYRFTKEQKKIATENQNQLNQITAAKHGEISEQEAHFQDRISQQTNEFTTRFNNDSNNYRKIKDDQDRTFKKERLSTNLRQQTEMAKMSKVHTDTVEVQDKEFRKGIKEQNLFYEDKFAKNLEARNQELKRLDELNAKVTEKMKGDLQEKLVYHVKRSDDPFYRFTELKPTLKEFEDRVEIRVEVPEHSKSDVQLTLHGKEAIVSFNRRYDDTRKDGQITNKLHKVESFTTRLGTSHFLDPKSVKANYQDGVMTYTVKRA